jgi:hypothetical protein
MNELRKQFSSRVAVTVAVKGSVVGAGGPKNPVFTGAAYQNRTDDLLITSEMLYRLS